LDTYDFAKMHFKGEGRSHIDEFWCGAFTHPVRGRCKFVATENDFAQYLREMKEDADIPIYSPNQLYVMTPVMVTTESVLYDLLNYWLKEPFNLNLYEAGFGSGYHKFEAEVEKEGRIQFRYIVRVNMDSDESWVLATLWFDGKPVAVLTRRGEDDYAAHVSDQPQLHRMVEWVHSLAPKPEEEGSGVVDPDKPQEFYTESGSHTLHDFYDVKSGLPKRPPRYLGWNHHYGGEKMYAEEEQ
jgi:hypothetical protein